MLWSFQVSGKGTQPYTHMYPYLFSPKTPSHPGWHVTLSRVPCVIQQVLVGFLNIAVTAPDFTHFTEVNPDKNPIG